MAAANYSHNSPPPILKRLSFSSSFAFLEADFVNICERKWSEEWGFQGNCRLASAERFVARLKKCYPNARSNVEA